MSRHLKGTPVGQKDFKRLFYRDFLGILYPAEFLSSLSPNGENERMEKKKNLLQSLSGLSAHFIPLWPFVSFRTEENEKQDKMSTLY